MIGPWLSAFLFTQAVEMPVYYAHLKHLGRWDAWGAAFLLSLATHPIVWYVFPELIHGSWLGMVAGAESFAIGVEALLLWRLRAERPLLVALVANCLSAGLGLLSRSVLGWP